MGMKGLVWSASAMGVLLNEGIGDTIRVSCTPKPARTGAKKVRRVRDPAGARLRSFSPKS
jgi:(E)-4-hydroxy-3-methylbut-2-enyl-diphosphate synthase